MTFEKHAGSNPARATLNEHDITICAKCRYHQIDGLRTDTWYNWFCTHPAVERQLGIDPVTGRKCYTMKNDLGRIVVTDNRHPYCRDINDGYCELYDAAPRRTDA